MKIATIRLRQEPYKSFIVHHEKYPFTPWHHHPEYELVLIIKGKGRRCVGDHVARFVKNDLVFLGPGLPHQWICETSADFTRAPFDEAFVIQFAYDFIGHDFFEIPENASLKRFLVESTRGYEFFGHTKTKIISILHEMADAGDMKRFYALMRIFEILGSTSEYSFLSSPSSLSNYPVDMNHPMQIAMQFILQNFQRKIKIEELLEVTHMSYASFYPAFKKTYQMPFKEYILKLRIGYACKLLTEGTMYISEIAYDSGFDNISNFNRQFKKTKGTTPSTFQKQFLEQNLQTG